MFVRKICAALGATAVVTAGLALTAVAPASADPASTPGATDLVGVGSDTTQFVVTDLINGKTVNGKAVAGYNATHSPKAASFDACTVPAGKMYPCSPGGDITLRTGTTAIPRPNGSGAGKGLIYGSADNPAISFARSSSGLNTAEVNAGLVAYPFAVDTLVTVTAPTTNAPATLTPQQILGIYTGKYTNWSQLGGKSGAINALKPQSGSGTLSFFTNQLQTINGGTAVTVGGKDSELANPTTGAPCSTASSTCVQTLVEEHDPTLITHDPNAIAPFSLGRANLAGASAVKVVKGWSARRALYNVVRGHDSGNAGAPDNANWFAGTSAITGIFGTSGFICSAAARPIIEADGFKQLRSFADGGSCGLPVTSTSAPDLSVYDGDATPAIVRASVGNRVYAAGHPISISVTGAGGTPTGTVSVNLGSWRGRATLSSGRATIIAPATLPVRNYAATVSYSGDATFGTASTTIGVGLTKARSVASETFPAKTARKARRFSGKVRIALSPARPIKPTGVVRIYRGSRLIARASLHQGVATFKLNLAKLKKLKKGRNTLTLKYAGNANIAGVHKKFKVTRR